MRLRITLIDLKSNSISKNNHRHGSDSVNSKLIHFIDFKSLYIYKRNYRIEQD